MEVLGSAQTQAAQQNTDAPNPPAGASGAPQRGDRLGKQDFLELLVTQLRNQDPMNPMKGQEFAAQLAQFSSVEQLININDTLGQQQGGNNVLSQQLESSMAANMLGTRIQAQGNTISRAGDGDTTLRFTTEGPATNAVLSIRNRQGQVVRTEELSALDKGEQTFAWDGTNDAGEAVPDGTYSFSVDAVDGEGAPVRTNTFLSGVVDRVTFNQEGIQLWVGDSSIPFRSVQSIEQP